MASAFVDQIAVIAFIGLLAWAAFSDYRTYLIPNAISLAVVALYPAHVLASSVPVDWTGGLVVAACVLAVGFILFAMRLAGGGDIKMLTAVSLWAGPAHILPFLLLTAIAGGLLALTTLGYLRYVRPLPSNAIAADKATALKLRASVPYGIAVAVGGLWLAIKMLGQGA